MPSHRPLTDTLELRPARAADLAALHRLAALDSQSPPGAGDHLIALTGDMPIAAIAMRGDWHAADPFQRSAGALELLRARRAQLRRADRVATRGGARRAARVVASISRG